MTEEQQPQNVSMMLYRITLLEQQLHQVQDQLKAYVPAKENELQLQNIQTSVARIERDVIDMKSKQEALEKESRLRDENQKLSQANLQIRAMWAIISAIILAATGVFVGYVTHFFH